MRRTARPMVGLVAIVMMTVLVACGGGKKLKLVVERETVIHDPVIQSVTVDGPARLDTRVQGHTVGVSMVGDPGLTGTFDVAGMFKGRALAEGPAGVYKGSFEVPRGASATLDITGHLMHAPTGAHAATMAKSALEFFQSAEPPRSDCPKSVAQAFDQELQRLVLRFDLDSPELTTAAQQLLSSQKELLNSNPLCKIFVYGHTDQSGSERYNVVLSAQRAIKVGRFMESLGVEQKRLEKHPMGMLHPASTGKTEEDEAQNRRVEIRAVVPYR